MTAAVAELYATAQRALDRVAPEELAAEVAAGAVLVDIRPDADRVVDGVLPGAVVIERIVLEWRLDPTSPHRIAEAIDADVRFVLVCNEGYASCLAAATLRQLGLTRVTDLEGGYRSWQRTVGDSVSPWSGWSSTL